MGSLARTGAAAIIGIAIILLALFKSVPSRLCTLNNTLGVTSVIWTFYLCKPLSFLGMIGVIALAGVIVNNIVLIDFINQLEQRVRIELLL